MSDSNRLERRYKKETTFGVVPTAPELTEIRCIGEDFNGQTTSTESPEARSDAQIIDATQTNISGTGTLRCALVYLANDWVITSALRGNAFSGDSATATDNGGTVQLAIASNVITSSGATGFDWVAQGFDVGRWVRLKGWTTNVSSEGGPVYAKISARDTTTLTLTGISLTNETGPTNCTVTLGEEVTNGTTQDTYFIQRQYTDLSNEYRQFKGFTPSGLSLNIRPSSLALIDFPFLGKDEAAASSEPASATHAANPGEDSALVNTSSNIPQLYVGGVALDVVGCTMRVDNNYGVRESVGNFGPVSIRGGRCRVTWDLELYCDADSLSEYDKLRSQTASDIALAITDADGNGMLYETPRVKYQTGSANGADPDTDVFVRLTGQAVRDPDEEITVRYVRWAS